MTLAYQAYDKLPQVEGKPYKHTNMDFDFCEVGVQNLLRYVGAADIYSITCGEYVYWDVKGYLDRLPMPRCPFWAVINLNMDRRLEKREWYITAIRFDKEESRSIGTRGL